MICNQQTIVGAFLRNNVWDRRWLICVAHLDLGIGRVYVAEHFHRVRRHHGRKKINGAGSRMVCGEGAPKTRDWSDAEHGCSDPVNEKSRMPAGRLG